MRKLILCIFIGYFILWSSSTLACTRNGNTLDEAALHSIAMQFYMEGGIARNVCIVLGGQDTTRKRIREQNLENGRRLLPSEACGFMQASYVETSSAISAIRLDISPELLKHNEFVAKVTWQHEMSMICSERITGRLELPNWKVLRADEYTCRVE